MQGTRALTQGVIQRFLVKMENVYTVIDFMDRTN